jgi:ATP-dependent DNA helicase RecQ
LTYVEVAENPARVIFRVGRDDLYNIDVSKRTELVMLTILRFYSGVFTEFRAIDELEIASAAKLHPVEVRESLKELWIRQIIRYVPANSSPMICMNEERLPLADLYIAPKTYSERKAQMMACFDTMIEYADNNSQCRSVVIQRYFGDTSAEPCGCCDICLAKKRGVESADIEREVEKILVKGNSTLRDIAHAIQLPPQKISAALSKMAESGAITISDAGDVALVADRGSEK